MKTFILFLALVIGQFAFGQNWNQQYSGTTKKLYSVTSSNMVTWICGDSGTVLKSTNYGTNWINMSGNGIPIYLKLQHIFCHKYYTSSYNELRYAYTTGSDNSGSYIYMTSNSGTNWLLVHTIYGSGNRFNAIWFKDTLNGVALGEPFGGRWQIWKTTNRGVNWDSAGYYFNGTNYSGVTNNLYGLQNYFRDSVLFFGATYNNTESRVFRSTNFGKNWTTIFSGNSHPLTGISYANTGNQKLVIGGNKFYGITTNGGSSWSTVDSVLFTSTQVCTVTDGYSSPSFIMKTDSIGRQTVYISWSFNYYTVSASGLKGMNYLNGFNWNVYLVGDSGKIYNRQILYPLVKKEGTLIPEKFGLNQNYPNPFNPSTIIRFQIKDLKFVSLKVFDIHGKEIMTLVNEKLNAGEYDVEFDGNGLSSGAYFYKLQTGDYSETKKMILLK